jgi:hypothetical protein
MVRLEELGMCHRSQVNQSKATNCSKGRRGKAIQNTNGNVIQNKNEPLQSIIVRVGIKTVRR